MFCRNKKPSPRQAQVGLPVRDSAGVEIGLIKHNPVLQNAYCRCYLHEACVKTRSLRASRERGSGAPLGFLAAWCRLQAQYGGKEAHIQHCKPDFGARRSARNALKAEEAFPQFSRLEQLEREEGFSEPEVVPKR